jgi:hypothetical protein
VCVCVCVCACVNDLICLLVMLVEVEIRKVRTLKLCIHIKTQNLQIQIHRALAHEVIRQSVLIEDANTQKLIVALLIECQAFVEGY